MTRIHLLRTGSVMVKEAQRLRQGDGGLTKVLLGQDWTEWLPIHAWLIQHDEGLFVVDTGETARATQPGYFPRWQPYFKLAVRIDVSPGNEIGHKIRELGLDPQDVSTVVLTHLHTDHAGGLHHFPSSEIRVPEGEYKSAQGFRGMLQGYLPHRWPEWFKPKPIQFEPKPIGPFEESYALTSSGDIVIVPTPGHTAYHVSVIVKSEDVVYFLAGDTSYSQDILLQRKPDGVSPNPMQAIETLDKIRRYSQIESLVYLPTHDPETAKRFTGTMVLENAP